MCGIFDSFDTEGRYAVPGEGKETRDSLLAGVDK